MQLRIDCLEKSFAMKTGSSRLGSSGHAGHAAKSTAGIIYIDQDADITSIASKVNAEHHKHLKIVVPKNCAAFKSGVNLKLLYRTASIKSKEVSLVTSDARLITMAAVAKIATSPNLEAEPVLPNKIDLKLATDSDEKVAKIEPVDIAEDMTIDSTELGALTKAQAEGLKDDPTEKLDPKEMAVLEDSTPAAKTATKFKKGGEKGAKKIPNFDKFRKKLFIIGGIILLLLIVLFLIFNSRKSALIGLRAQAKRVDISLETKLNPNIDESTATELKVSEYKGSKTIEAKVPATGQEDKGQKATGKLTVTNCTDNSVTIASGAGFSSGSQTYISSSSVTVPASNFFSNGSCKKDGTNTVNVTAKESGESYNSGSRSYTISSVSSSVTAQGSTSGGTTQIVKVVTQADLDNLKAKLSSQDQKELLSDIQSKVDTSEKSLDETFKVSSGSVKTAAYSGQEAEEISGSTDVSYSIYGLNQEELKKVIAKEVESKKENPNQAIIKDGIDTLKFSLVNNRTYQLSTTAFLGPNLDQDALKDSILGKKKGEALEIINKMEGISGTKVSISPFWATNLPGSRDKVTLNIDIDETLAN
jgi:hypothetical protein